LTIISVQGLPERFQGRCHPCHHLRGAISSHEMTAPAPGCSLIITGHCPHLEGRPSCMFHCSLWEVLVPCHRDVISSVLSGIQGDCKVTVKRMAETDTKWRQGCQASPVFNFSPSKESVLFQQKQFECLLQFLYKASLAQNQPFMQMHVSQENKGYNSPLPRGRSEIGKGMGTQAGGI
jgi:hypothetical protein